MKHWVMDYETLSNCFTGVFEHYKTNETKVFVVHDLRNDFDEFIDFLEQNVTNKEWHISYNGLAFDGQITQYIIDNHYLWKNISACEIANILYKYAQYCIDKSNKKEFMDYPQWKMKIGQIDLFKMHHWDNPAKRSSLKWIQYSMDWDNILDMPIHHESEIKTIEEIDTVLEYNINDVRSTKEIFNRSTDLIKLRKELTNTYNINLYSASEPRISKELFGYYMSEKLNIHKRDLKQMRTYRSVIKFEDIILPYISFTSPEFNQLLNRFKAVELDPDNLKGAFKYSVTYKNVKTDFGVGGVHGANKNGVYESDEDTVIMSSDVTSFYPNLVIRNGWAPGHFPASEFCDQYEWFFEERKKIPKSDPRNYVYKIVLNSTYGLSNDENSFLYDPELTMRITINGQLSLMMLYVMLVERIPGAVPIMQNTDGLETMIPRKYEAKYIEICSEWEKLTNLQLEHDTYQKLIVPDVNNYIGINSYKEVDKDIFKSLMVSDPEMKFKRENGKCFVAKTKCKGRFEFKNRALHKNKSFTVVAKALYNYFVHNIKPEDYIKTNKNVFDYCGQVKAKGSWKFKALSVVKQELHVEDVQKTLRYFVSNKGCKIIKKNTSDEREINVEAGKWLQTIFNEYEEKDFADYNINLNFYLDKINKEIKQMSPELFHTQYQLEL